MLGIYQHGLVHEQDAGVRLQVDSRGLLDDLESLDGDVGLIGETEAYEVQHGRQEEWISQPEHLGFVISEA